MKSYMDYDIEQEGGWGGGGGGGWGAMDGYHMTSLHIHEYLYLIFVKTPSNGRGKQKVEAFSSC